jgi:hypothetical protein
MTRNQLEPTVASLKAAQLALRRAAGHLGAGD